MLGLAIAIGFLAVVAGLIGLVLRLSGRRYPGDITGDQGNAVDYDDYYVGWNIFGKPGAPGAEAGGGAPGGTAPDDFAQWEAEQRQGRGRDGGAR